MTTPPTPILDLLRDPRAVMPAPTPQAHAEAMLRAHVLGLVSRALVARGERAMLVKGAALALTIYPSPAARPMSDVDLLVPPQRERAVIEALAAAGLELHENRFRPRSREMLGETQLVARAGEMRLLVEVHGTLDKIVPRPIDLTAVEDRATPAPGLSGLLLPSAEDHALLVALHAAGHEFRHDIALLDLELLMRGGIDKRVLVERAREFRLGTVMFVMLSTLRALGAASVDPALVQAFDPGRLRRAALVPFYDVGGFPVPRTKAALGIRWVVGQTPLRDDLGAWARGLARYAAARVGDRITAR
ncbi:nucleotidyltransferase family protein [Polyangium jinanense]|uniref:Nucleotidyltransferase family protein n=1 Tax=Polyangium jinanense TaxID=2829994 RepID=A0A9X4AU76_9BACT|nr:nucleotidyltransferase family protein [Polyangium jinanense]MDC3957527.1 nucleotidyltransferase family protein [Polyangium jinanense]MDC3984983.1 nucleotidyltransferase family protein [Polyangium jinanense]